MSVMQKSRGLQTLSHGFQREQVGWTVHLNVVNENLKAEFRLTIFNYKPRL